MASVIARLTGVLRPTPSEVVALAQREVDPSQMRSFQPITRGPVIAVVLLAWIGVAAIATAPFRLIARLKKR